MIKATVSDSLVSSPSKALSDFEPRAWVIMGTAALFYLYEYILRVSPSVMTQELMRDFHVTSTAVGVLASFYYYSYVALQVPCGMIADWLGPRRVVTFSALLCVGGSVLFSRSDSLLVAEMSRFLIGAGSACAYVCCTKIGAEWFVPSRFAFLSSFTMAMGTLGGTFGNKPFAMLVNAMGWRSAMFIAGLAGLGVALAAWLIIRDRPYGVVLPKAPDHQRPTARSVWEGLQIVLANPQSWLIGIYGGLMYVPLSAFGELWSVPFLMNRYQVDNELAATANIMMLVGISVGCPLSALLSNYLESRLKVMSWAAVGMLFLFLVIIYVPTLPLSIMFILLFLTGMVWSGQILYFAASKEINPSHLSGTSISFCNCFVMVSGIIFQPLLGWLLDVAWDGCLGCDGTPLYSIRAYQVALTSVPVCLILSWVVLKFIKETYHLTKHHDPL
jgi:sugar phosphate permease